MKITKHQLKQIIKEELTQALDEQESYADKLTGVTNRETNVDADETSRSLSQTIQNVSGDKVVDVSREISNKGEGVKGEHTIDISDGGESTSLSKRTTGDSESMVVSKPRGETNQPIQLPGQKKSLNISSGGKTLQVGDPGYFEAQEDLGFPGIPESGDTSSWALGETLKRWKVLIND